MSHWKWSRSSADHLGQTLDENVKALNNQFKREIKKMTLPSSSKSRSRLNSTVTYHPESSKRLVNMNKPSRQPKRQCSHDNTALPSSNIPIKLVCVLILQKFVQVLPKLHKVKQITVTLRGYELGSMVNMDIPASANVEDTGMHANIN